MAAAPDPGEAADPVLAAAANLLRHAASRRQHDWPSQARADQKTPKGVWNVWLILAGRGWGKTRTGAEDVAAYARTHGGVRVAVVAPTYADARDTCVEGESGLLNVIPDSELDTWNRSLGELVLVNRSRFKLFSADEPDRLRGPQHHRAWADEVAAWRYPRDAWDQLMFGLRLGSQPRAVATTTPRPIELIRELLNRDKLKGGDVHVTRGSTFDNARNLAPAALAQLKARYAGTHLGRQELYAELLDEMPGALWSRSNINEHRVTNTPDLRRIVVAVDPAVTSASGSAETGILVAGVAHDPGTRLDHVYVLEDLSCRLSPDQWMRQAVAGYHKHACDRLVAETNNGGDMVEVLLRTVDPSVAYRKVTASRGKRVRAEPVAALYEQGRVHHVGQFEALEDQLVSWTPDAEVSPDRLDALVWAVTDLVGAGWQIDGWLMR